MQVLWTVWTILQSLVLLNADYPCILHQNALTTILHLEFEINWILILHILAVPHPSGINSSVVASETEKKKKCQSKLGAPGKMTPLIPSPPKQMLKSGYD